MIKHGLAFCAPVHKCPKGVQMSERRKIDGSNPRRFRGIRFVFLDRDGILNRKLPEGQYVGTCRDIELLVGAAEAVAKLNYHGQRVIVVTNQRNIARGALSEEGLA